jgi:hypothetical protein
MVPGLNLGLNLAKLADFALSSYDKSQNVEANEKMSLARETFQKSEKSIIEEAVSLSISKNISPNAALDEVYGSYVDDSSDRLDFSGPTVGGPISQPSVTGTALGPAAYEAVSSPVSQPSVTGTALGALGGGLQGGGSGSTGLYGDAFAGVDLGVAPDVAVGPSGGGGYNEGPSVGGEGGGGGQGGGQGGENGGGQGDAGPQ